MPEKLSFIKNIPATVTFSKKTSDWFGELRTHEEWGDSYAYKMAVTSSEKYAGGPHVAFFTPILQELIEFAGVERGDTVSIEQAEDTEDKRKVMWKIVKDGATYLWKAGKVTSSAATDKPEPDQKPGPEPSATTPSQPPEETAPARPDIPPAEVQGEPPSLTNAYEKRPLAISFAERCARRAKCYRAAPTILALGHIEATPEFIVKEAISLIIECEKGGVRLKESEVQEFIEGAKKLARVPSATTSVEPATPPDAPIGDEPISGDDLFDLYQQAKEAGIEEPVFEFMVRQLMAVQLRTRHLPERYPLSNCPKSLVPHIVDWISANAITLNDLSQKEAPRCGD